ncbi:response regulator transcription factor [Vibrio coralliilyticus]|uniref:Response regulator transcription factor n=1 Tax=Vibrio coralliilyticus TaxID=190893 RepID=A0AAP7DBJ0_9VIBR|nr:MULTISPECIES: response regulator transcription factor [Vibrio]AIW20987.1 transcriptional regulator [Vibrio coralliilyticus]AXN34323.1 DNA-binding response regulator [Vibrio coralliilyticus]ERB66147.1 transcriptional regulator [Vibrio coralliilyticus OCN008]KFI11169.1 transcriptional regulator [Vibrio sp. B183]KPH24147.1 transcriptional regulator [Vibrio coralliilyticus]
MKSLLLIEDDKLLGQGLVSLFESNGYQCVWVQETRKVEQLWFKADLVILDRQLSDGDSLKHLPHWLLLKAVPVIILTAKIDTEQKVEGLMAGAKDYVTKPFSHDELLARVVSQLRPLGASSLCYGGIELHLAKREAMFNDQLVTLKPKEFQLLVLLIQNQGRVFHRDELLNKVWGYQAFPSTRTIDNHILRLRQKLPVLNIETHRGVGYRLNEEAL